MRDKKVWLKWIITILSVGILLRPLKRIVCLLINVPAASVRINGFNEVRDYVNFRLAHLIYEGINPYSLDVVSQTNAPLMFFYPAMYPLMVAVLSRLTGLSIMASYYAVNILLVVLTAVCVWLIIKDVFKDKASIIIGILCASVCTTTFFSVFGLPIFNFHTDTAGILLTVVMFLIVCKKKELTLPLAVISVLLIFTKQILLIMVVPLFVYYMIRDRKLALRYFIECIVCGLVTVAVVQLCFPLYWTETIYAQFCVNNSAGTINSALWNLFHFYNRYNVMIFFDIIAGIVLAVRRIRNRDQKVHLDEKDWYTVFLLLNVVIGTLSMLYIARGDADGSKYCQDILAPSLFMLTVFLWSKCISYINVKHKQLGFAGLIVISALTAVVYLHFQVVDYSDAAIANYVELDNVIAEHEGENIYLSMLANSYSMNRNMWEDDHVWTNDGQIEYFYLGEYSDNDSINALFYRDIIENAADNYVEEVNSMVSNKEFGVVTTCCERVLDMDLLAENYYVYNHYLLLTDTNGFVDVYVWLPREV